MHWAGGVDYRPESREDRDYEDMLGYCQRRMGELRMWKFVWVVNRDLRRQTTILNLEDRLNEVTADNVGGCVNEAEAKF